MLIYTQISGCVLSFIHITTSVYSPICVCAQLLKNVQLSCDLMDCSLPGSSIHGISQARILEGVAISSSRGIFPTQGSNPICLHCRRILYRWVTWEALDRGHACTRVCAKSLQSCQILWDAIDPTRLLVHGILQARTWSGLPCPPQDWTCVSYVSCIGRQVLYPYCHLGAWIEDTRH